MLFELIYEMSPWRTTLIFAFNYCKLYKAIFTLQPSHICQFLYLSLTGITQFVTLGLRQTSVSLTYRPPFTVGLIFPHLNKACTHSTCVQLEMTVQDRCQCVFCLIEHSNRSHTGRIWEWHIPHFVLHYCYCIFFDWCSSAFQILATHMIGFHIWFNVE